MAKIIFEKLEDYQNSVEKALAGFLTGKPLDDLTADEIKKAKALSEKLTNWNDYLELSFALDREDSKAVNKILQKLEESNNHLSFLPVNLFINEKISNHWIAEGFNYALHCDNADIRDDIIEWLESNSIKFQLVDEYKICVECDDRETIYKIGRAVTRLNRKKHTVIDSVRDSMVEDKDKMKIAIPASEKPRNPMSGVLNNPLFHPKTEKSRQEKIKKVDQWDRKAKHKTKTYESTIVNQEKTKVMEMNDLPEIKRLKKLAGIRMEEESPLAPGPVKTNVEVPMMGSAVTDMPVIKNAADDLAVSMDLPPDSSIPAVSTDVPVATTPVGSEPETTSLSSSLKVTNAVNPTTSQQYAQASDLLDQVLALVADLKLSEYKMFSNRVNQFVDSVRGIGKAMISESRKQK